MARLADFIGQRITLLDPSGKVYFREGILVRRMPDIYDDRVWFGIAGEDWLSWPGRQPEGPTVECSRYTVRILSLYPGAA